MPQVNSMSWILTSLIFFFFIVVFLTFVFSPMLKFMKFKIFLPKFFLYL